MYVLSVQALMYQGGRVMTILVILGIIALVLFFIGIVVAMDTAIAWLICEGLFLIFGWSISVPGVVCLLVAFQIIWLVLMDIRGK